MDMCELIAMDDIDTKGDYFGVRVTYEDVALSRSIEQYGVLEPLCVRKVDTGYQLLSGFRRYYALKSLGQTHCAVLIVTDVYDNQEQFERVLAANSSYSDADRFVIFNKAIEMMGFSEDECVLRIAPLVGIHPSPRVVKDYLSLSRLIPEAQKKMCDGSWNLKVLIELSRFTVKEQSVLCDTVFAHCFFSASDMVKICDVLRQLIKRNDISMQILCSQNEIEAVLTNADMNPKEKGVALLTLLKGCMFPLYSKMKGAMADILGESSLPKNISVTETPYFERDEFTVQMTVSSVDQFQKSISSLREMTPSIKRLFNIPHNVQVDE